MFGRLILRNFKRAVYKISEFLHYKLAVIRKYSEIFGMTGRIQQNVVWFNITKFIVKPERFRYAQTY